MRITRTLTALAVATSIAAAAPATSSARPIDGVTIKHHGQNCYQTGPIVGNSAGTRHRVLCDVVGGPVPANRGDAVTVAKLHSEPSGGFPWETVAIGIALTGVALSAAAVTTGRQRRSRRRRVAV
jgi:hypothetical protein